MTLRAAIALALLGVTACHHSQADAPADSGPPGATSGPSSFAKIADAEKAGTIDHDTALMYRVFALYDRSRLPAEYAGDDTTASHEGSQLLVEVATRLSKMSPSIADPLQPFLARPDSEDSFWGKKLATTGASASALHTKGGASSKWSFVDDSSGHVRVWYPPGWADAAARAAGDAKTAWPIERDAMLGTEPCKDGTLAGNDGGSDRLDVYLTPGFIDIPRTRYDFDAGPTDAEGNGVQAVTLPLVDAKKDVVRPAGCTGFVSVIMLDPLRTKMGVQFDGTLVHEMFHAFQEAFAASVDPSNAWLAEASATWAEDLVFPDNDSEHIQLHVSTWTTPTPGPLDAYSDDTDVQYGTYLWPFFLTRGKGMPATTIGTIYRDAFPKSALQLMTELPNFPDLFSEFLTWNVNEGGLKKYEDKTPLTDLHPLAPPDVEYKLVTRAEPAVFSHKVEPLHGLYVVAKPDDADTPRWVIDFGAFNSPHVKIKALLKFAGRDDQVVDWSGLDAKVLCTNKPDEDPSEITLIIANTSVDPAHAVTGDIKIRGSDDTCAMGGGTVDYTGTLTAAVSDPASGATGTYSYAETLSSKLTLKFVSKSTATGTIFYDVTGTHTINVTGGGSESSTGTVTSSAMDTISGAGTIDTPLADGAPWPFPGSDPKAHGGLTLNQDGTFELDLTIGGVAIHRSAARHSEFTCPAGTKNTHDEVWDDAAHDSRVSDYDCVSGTSSKTDAVPSPQPLACMPPFARDAFTGMVPKTGPIDVSISQTADCTGNGPIGCWDSYWYSPVAVSTCKIEYTSHFTFDPPVRW